VPQCRFGRALHWDRALSAVAHAFRPPHTVCGSRCILYVAAHSLWPQTVSGRSLKCHAAAAALVAAHRSWRDCGQVAAASGKAAPSC